jgi:UDP-GlcNAc3NAcA epimerase
MKILTIIGARPQFIKAAAVSREFSRYSDINEVIIHTGQHFDKNMSDIFFDEMNIPHPNYYLEINSLSHGAMTGRMMEAIEKIIEVENPDFTMVYGDTNSTLAGALAAKKKHCKLVHVEAGLRSFNMDMPEEINRILTDRISDVLFCPTDTAVLNLYNEGFAKFQCRIVQNGDVMEDAALFYSKMAGEKSTIIKELNLEGRDFVLCTIHRAENTDDPKRLANLVHAINQVNAKMHVVMPLHPRTLNTIKANNLSLDAKVLSPIGYFDMIRLIQESRIVMTDSGGLQKEAFFFNKYCITLRDQTEWLELINHDYNRLVGVDPHEIFEAFDNFIGKTFNKAHDFYGGGKASSIIVDTLLTNS